MKNKFIYVIRNTRLLLICALLVSCSTGKVKENTDDVSEAQKIINIDSDIKDQFDLAVSYLKSADYDKAITLLEKLIEVEKRVPAPYVNLSIAYEYKGDKEKAEKYLLKAVSIDLAHPVANNRLGHLYRRQGKFDDARKAYTNALTKHPDYLPVIKNLGILCDMYLRDLECALQQFEHYQELKPDDKTMKIWISDLSQRMN
ncbi:hypothetical protein MNBD_GAMMA09-1683 [hydrothermal vent metagenome]|uniref:Uncharacterized protein n=1 Tax=hydrothermal vent metagenome TaxID=652676 RepID=A0A3B0XIZ2_9ZZZZ